MTRRESELERWLATIAGRQPLAVILGTSWNALSFARSLGRRGVPILLLEDTGRSMRHLGSYTRYGKLFPLPPMDHDPEAWIRILRFVGARVTDPAVLVPTGDGHVLFLSHYEPVLRACFRFVLPARETVLKSVNKRLQYAAAQQAGIPIPRTYFPESAEQVRELSAELSFPILLKPYESHVGRKVLGQKVLVARSTGELVAGYERLAGQGVEAMVQQIIPGGDDALFGYLAVWDGDGRELAWLTKRKLRQYPPGFGDGSLLETVEAPEVAELSRRLLRAFDFRGFALVEFKRDPASGIYYLMEINPRASSNNQMAISSGVDLPWIGYRCLTGSDGATEPAQAFRPGVKFINEELDIHAYRALRKSDGMTVGQWVRSIRGTTSTAIWARDDPLPFTILVWRLARPSRRATGRSRVARGFRALVRLALRRP
jgi:predicted ATP-grasp superfamily ATP-dependent carboligase